MKKIISALVMTTLLFSPVGTSVFQDHATVVEAKGYKSGKRGFNNNNPATNNNSTVKRNQDTTTNRSAATPTKGFFSGGLMRGLMLGGLAGLLFGGLLANFGILGSILGFLINVFAIILLISVIRRIFAHFKNKKKNEDPNPWRS